MDKTSLDFREVDLSNLEYMCECATREVFEKLPFEIAKEHIQLFEDLTEKLLLFLKDKGLDNGKNEQNPTKQNQDLLVLEL